MVFEEEYEDVLQNIETIIIGFYKQNPNMKNTLILSNIDINKFKLSYFLIPI